MDNGVDGHHKSVSSFITEHLRGVERHIFLQIQPVGFRTGHSLA